VPAIPLVAVIGTVLLYAVPPRVGDVRVDPFVGGIVIALVIWALLAGLAVAFRLTASDQADSRSYSDLCQRLQALYTKLQILSPPPAPTPVPSAISSLPRWSAVSSPEPVAASETPAKTWNDNEEAAHAEAASTCGVIAQELGRPGLSWVMGSGYINLWTLVHRAEEAVIEFDFVEEVVAGAVNDSMRVSSSKIDADSQKQLLAEIIQAVNVLDPAALAYLGTQTVTSQSSATPNPTLSAHVMTNPSMVVAVPGPDGAKTGEQQSRSLLRHVRFVINDFRDGLWDRLVRRRNHLLVALTLTGIATYLLLVLAVSAQVATRSISGAITINYATDPIIAATACYLVGAVVGLFNILYAGTDESDMDDYGLTAARIVLSPVLSGLAAVLGVFLVAVLPATFSVEVLSPSAPTMPVPTIVSNPAPAPSPTAAAGEGIPQSNAPTWAFDMLPVGPTAAQEQPAPAATPTPATQMLPAPAPPPPIPTLDMVFNLTLNRFALVVAAAFGLTPSLLINAIKRVPDQYKAALQSTQSTSRQNTS
jgi:hypothetical protein